MALFDSKSALNHAIKYLSETAMKRAAGGEVSDRARGYHERKQKLLQEQFPTQYMPNVGRQVMQGGGVPDQPQRQLSPMGFYSAAAERAQTLQPSGDAVQMVNALKNTQGIKTEELQNAGLIDQSGNVHPDWAGRGKVTRDELVSHLQGQMPQIEERVLGMKPTGYGHKTSDEWNEAVAQAELAGNWDEANRLQEAWEQSESAPTKYHQYTLPGGENYREVLLRYAESPEQKLNRAKSLVDPAVWARMTDEQKQQFLSAPDKGIYQSPHWKDPNVLAHIRMSDRTGPNGEKILHVEELQSDWGQKGKKEGFAIGPKEKAAAQAKIKEIEKQVAEQGHDATSQQQQEYMRARAVLDHNGIPSAPYVTSTEGWTDLALKRVLKEAAEGGYDKVVWTPGAEQAKRYDLSKQISELELVHNKNGEGKLTFVDKNLVPHQQDVKNPEHLAELVGKDLAEKLYEKSKENNGMARLTGLDLKVGGEGMKGYYDSIVPKRLQNIAKKYDKEAKLGYTETHHRGQVSNAPMSYTLPSLDITPAMREAILRGQSAYKRGGAVSKRHPALSIAGTHIREEEHGEPIFTGGL